MKIWKWPHCLVQPAAADFDHLKRSMPSRLLWGAAWLPLKSVSHRLQRRIILLTTVALYWTYGEAACIGIKDKNPDAQANSERAGWSYQVSPPQGGGMGAVVVAGWQVKFFYFSRNFLKYISVHFFFSYKSKYHIILGARAWCHKSFELDGPHGQNLTRVLQFGQLNAAFRYQFGTSISNEPTVKMSFVNSPQFLLVFQWIVVQLDVLLRAQQHKSK